MPYFYNIFSLIGKVSAFKATTYWLKSIKVSKKKKKNLFRALLAVFFALTILHSYCYLFLMISK